MILANLKMRVARIYRCVEVGTIHPETVAVRNKTNSLMALNLLNLNVQIRALIQIFAGAGNYV